MSTYPDATLAEINEALLNSRKAFEIYRKCSLKQRAAFLLGIAKELQEAEKDLVGMAASETHLEIGRLKSELKRTIFQLTSYAAACEEGSWLDLRIDEADPLRNPPKPDLRKMMIPLGPVVVFGASNFPFAYSTAGGDTACALAAGCSVLVKAHPAHAGTSSLVAEAISKAALRSHLPASVFIHLHGSGIETGKALVEHPLTKAVGFTGSFEGGRALFDMASKRNHPIPVFAEMGSVNPVFILPGKLKENGKGIADMLYQSMMQSGGQFCTNPGILVALSDNNLENFRSLLSQKVKNTSPVKMLHAGIAASFLKNREAILKTEGVQLLATTGEEQKEGENLPTLAEVSALKFIQDPLLHKEVFGTFSLLVVCRNLDEMLEVARAMEGQLTATLIATKQELADHSDLVDVLQSVAGRIIFNGVPTGVEVALAMHHGGPFPATTDSRVTAVGADGIRRFSRPVCFQNWENDLLPDELKNENPLGLFRTVNNKISNSPLVNAG